MNKSAIALLTVAALSAAAMAAPASAQDEQKGMHRDMPAFADLDLNDDGVVAKDEFLKARSERIAKRAEEGRQLKNLSEAPSFDDLDENGDGGIDAEEFASHQEKCRVRRARR